MLIFCEQSDVFRDVNLFYDNKRCPRSYTLQHFLCLITKRTIRFRVKLKLNWAIHTLEFSIGYQKSHSFFTGHHFCGTMDAMRCGIGTTPRLFLNI